MGCVVDNVGFKQNAVSSRVDPWGRFFGFGVEIVFEKHGDGLRKRVPVGHPQINVLVKNVHFLTINIFLNRHSKFFL
jgi:hypothetical protein